MTILSEALGNAICSASVDGGDGHGLRAGWGVLGKIQNSVPISATERQIEQSKQHSLIGRGSSSGNVAVANTKSPVVEKQVKFAGVGQYANWQR